MATETTFSLPNLGDCLVIRIGPAGGAQSVYSIALTDLQQFQLNNVNAAQQQQLTAFFATNPAPKVDAAIAHAVHMYDGSATA